MVVYILDALVNQYFNAVVKIGTCLIRLIKCEWLISFLREILVVFERNCCDTKALRMGQNDLGLRPQHLSKSSKKKRSVFKGLIESRMMAKESSLEIEQSQLCTVH